jgi:hypothetical protein
MVECIFSVVEWHSEGLEGWTGPGALVLLVFLITLVCIGIGYGAAHQHPAQARKNTLGSNSAGGLWNKSSQDGALLENTFIDPKSIKKKKDKRKWMRRGGNAIEIMISDVAATKTPTNAMVLNRSRGGLLISAPQAASQGTIWSVRTTNAPENLPWIHIRVRHCQQKDDRWLWGCAFTEELPWSVLLLFG